MSATFPRPHGFTTLLTLERVARGDSPGTRADHLGRMLWAELLRYDAAGHLELTVAGWNALGRPAPGQPWGEWTVAWRRAKGNLATRAINWAGTWAEAVEMAESVGELLGDGYQVWYTTTLAQEQAESERIAAGTLDAAYSVDHANITLDTGRRLRVVDNGMVPAELLDRQVETVARTMRDAAITARGERYGHLGKYRALAAALKATMGADAWTALADAWTALAGACATADERSRASYLAQPWARREAEPADVVESERVMARAAEAARLAMDIAAAEGL